MVTICASLQTESESAADGGATAPKQHATLA